MSHVENGNRGSPPLSELYPVSLPDSSHISKAGIHFNHVFCDATGRNRARVAVAQKLLEIVYKVWKERPYYEKPIAVTLYIT